MLSDHLEAGGVALLQRAKARWTDLLEAGAVDLHVAAVHLQDLLRPCAHPGAERLDGRAVHAPLRHAELTQVGARVAGQGLPVLKVEAAQLAAGV